jgi:hypothetical protein
LYFGGIDFLIAAVNLENVLAGKHKLPGLVYEQLQWGMWLGGAKKHTYKHIM